MGAIILQIILIFLNATFASAEIAVISMNENKLKMLALEGNKKAQKLASLTSQPARFLATIQVAITLAGLLGSAFAAENFSAPLAKMLIDAGVSIPEKILKSICLCLITVILAYFNLVFGELVPKRIAMKKAESMALGMSGMLYTVSKIFAPLVFLLTASTNAILFLIGINPNENEEKVSEEEIRMLLDAGNEQGTIDKDENEIIQNVFEFDDISVSEICTHRIDVVVLSTEDSIAEWDKTIHNSRHNFYPVCSDNPEDIIGVLDSRDYFRMENKTIESVMEHAAFKPYFIPEGMKANVLFRNMKKHRCYFAVIIDEYGGLSGIITLHDLLETLVGDLYDSDNTTPAIIQKSDNEWQILGSAGLDDVADALDVSLPTEEFDTFNGYICSIIGRIPGDSEAFGCVTDTLDIKVHDVENHRINNTTVRKICF